MLVLKATDGTTQGRYATGPGFDDSRLIEGNDCSREKKKLVPGLDCSLD
jgi:hypothetical protein